MHFAPPKSKTAIERLVYRGRLRVWPQMDGDRTQALWTTRPWLEEFSRSGPRAGRLNPGIHRATGPDQTEVAALQEVVEAQSREILALRLELARFKHLVARYGQMPWDNTDS